MTTHPAVIARASTRRIAIPLAAPKYNSDGLNTHTVRTIIQIHDDAGRVGLGVLGAVVGEEMTASAMSRLGGCDPFRAGVIQNNLAGGKFPSQATRVLAGGIEMALLDLQGKILDRPVHDLLGGIVHDRIPMAGVLYRSAHGVSPPAADEAPEPVIQQAESLVKEHGFAAFKFKAGAAPIERDIEVMRALRDRFPQVQLRIDPNGSWTVESSMRAMPALAELELEWLEDPVLGAPGMCHITRHGIVPTATNMCLTNFDELHLGVVNQVATVVLTDLGYVGGLRQAQAFTHACHALGLGSAVHSGPLNQTGIGLAATLHFAAALPHTIHAADAVDYHNVGDIVREQFRYENGYLEVPTGPGIGVTLDQDKMSTYEDEYARLTSRQESLLAIRRPVYPRY